MFSKGGASIKRPVNIGTVIREAADFASRGSRSRIDFDLPKDLWVAEVDTGQISQAIHNLVINAAQAMPEGGTTIIRAKNMKPGEVTETSLPSAQYLQIEIEDHGCGISEDGLEQLFDPYYTTKDAGTGLGLAVTQSVIRNHGGEISVKSRVGEGTKFTLYLPASVSSVVEVEGLTDAVPVGTGRVLVLDDDSMIREMASEMLLEFGYEVESVADGEEAIRFYFQAKKDQRPFDLLLLDLTVPGSLGGEQVLQRIREVEPDVKAIISSGYARDRGPLKLLETGFASYLQKPYDLGSLARMVGKVIDAG
jgi:CheY-like chemotaxis protein